MSEPGWKQLILQGIGIRIEVMAELYPRSYLLFATVFALTGYAGLLLFPLLVLASMGGMYQALIHTAGIAWLQLLAWTLMAGFCGLVSYRIIQFRPFLPGGVVLDRGQAPDLFQLVEDTAGHYACPGIDRIVMTGAYQLDIVSTPRKGLPLSSTHSLVIGLPLMKCLSPTRFSCLLARRLGQFSKRTNPLLNWLYELRGIWPRYQVPVVEAAPGYLPLHRIMSIYARLYTIVSTAAARLDELQADSYAMELFGDEEVLDAITADTVYRLFLRERYWPAIRKLDAQDAATITKSHAGMVTVLHAGVQEHNIEQWIEQAMSMEQKWDDPWPLLARRLENIGHESARMDAGMTESAAESYLATGSDLETALEQNLRPAYPQVPPWSVQIAGLQRRLQSAMHSLVPGSKKSPHPG